MKLSKKVQDYLKKRFINLNDDNLNNISNSDDLDSYLEDIANNNPNPTKKTNHIGVELECISPCMVEEVKIKLIEFDLVDYVSVGYDSSIDNEDDESYEFRLLLTEKNYKQILTIFGKFLRAIEARTNNSCGLHVHLDMRNRDKVKSFSRLYNAQNVLYKMVAKHRHHNTYCERNYANNPQTRKYSAINGITGYSTIEVRLHQGTTRMTTVINWIHLLVLILNSKHEVKTPVSNYKDLRKFIKPRGELVKYLQKAT